MGSNPRPHDHQSDALTTKPEIASVESMENFCCLSDNHIKYTVASLGPDPNARRGGQLPYPNKRNSTVTSRAREDALIPNPNECNSTLMSGTKNIYPKP